MAGVMRLSAVGVGLAALAGVMLSPHATAVLVQLSTFASTVGPLLLRLFVCRLGVSSRLPRTPSPSPFAPALRGQLF